MNRMKLPRWAGVVAAAVAAVTLGTAAPASAQPSPLQIVTADCQALAQMYLNGGNDWVGFCSPVWKLPIGNPELGFGTPPNPGSGNATVTYDAGTQTLTLMTAVHQIWFDGHGNSDPLPGVLDTNPVLATVVIQVSVGADGRLKNVAHDACGDGTAADFCVTGATTATNPITGVQTHYGPGVLLRGTVEQFATQANSVYWDGPQDDFEFYVNVSGMDWTQNPLYNDFFFQKGYSHFLMEAFTYNDPSHPTTWVGNNPFGSSFAEPWVKGYAGATVNATGAIFMPDKCNGSVTGFVTDYFFGSGIDGVEVATTGHPNTPTDATGKYTSGGLCQGHYVVQALNPGSYTFYGSDSIAVDIALSADGVNNTVVVGANFKMYASAVNAAAFTTYNQASWGTNPRGNNTGKLLQTYFPYLYSAGVEVGIPGAAGFSLTETTSQYVADILPQEGRPMPLTADFVDNAGLFLPQHKGKLRHHRRIGSLAGEVLALEFNVRFSQWGLTKSGLGDLKVASGPLAGKTVNQILAYGNQMLGGG